MLGIRKNYRTGEFDLSASLVATYEASKEPFASDEMLEALNAICTKEEAWNNERMVPRLLSG